MGRIRGSSGRPARAGRGPVMASGNGGTSRRIFLKRAAAVAAAGGTISIMDELAGGITRAGAKTATPAHDEQYLVDGLQVVKDNGIEVVIPPLYKYIITGKLKRDRLWNAKELQRAQAKFEKALVQAEKNRPRTAAGLTLVVAWGLPYFRNFIRPLLAPSTWSSIWPRTVDGRED